MYVCSQRIVLLIQLSSEFRKYIIWEGRSLYESWSESAFRNFGSVLYDGSATFDSAIFHNIESFVCENRGVFLRLDCSDVDVCVTGDLPSRIVLYNC